MARIRLDAFVAAAAVCLSLAAPAQAQGRREDYARAQKFLTEEIKKIAYDGQVDAHWLTGTTRFWYLKDALESKEFLVVDAASGSKTPAFDHQRLAAALSTVAGRRYEARALPFSYVQFGNGGKTVAFAVD
jgi:dipeptidyl-peptidase 4